MKRLAFFLLTAAISFGYSYSDGVYTTNGTSEDVQSAINAASDGQIVDIPSGNHTWTTAVTVSGKGIHLRGAGAGRVIGRSTSSVAVGTGSKTFTTQSGLSISNGQTLRIERTGTPVSGGNTTGTRTYMIGTVTSYSGTSLQMSISSSGGSGTHPLWIISSTAATSITYSSSGSLVTITEDASHHVEVSGIRFLTGSGSEDFIKMQPTSGGKPILIHDCYFECVGIRGIYSETPRGIVWNSSFPSFPFSMEPLGIHVKAVGATTSWTTASTMGAADTTGSNNFYVEDCDFHAWLNACDFDDNLRAVWRNNLMNNAGFGTHGADTSNYGVRHYEIYGNTFVFNGYSDGNTFNLNWWFYLRGGTGVIADNTLPAITSTDYGTKTAINMTVMNLQRSGGPNPCWGANVAGNQYPAPRQVGIGRVTGSAGNDSITYVGDSEPLYIWNNSGGYSVGLSDYGGGECTNPDSSAGYIQSGRDYFHNAGAKPGWSPYTYPHPLRTDLDPEPPDEDPPTVVARAVAANGTYLTLKTDEAVVVGSGGDGGFTIFSNYAAVTVTDVEVIGTAIYLTASRTIYSSEHETLTLSYTQPGNGIEDLAGNDLESFSGQSVQNDSTQEPPEPPASGSLVTPVLNVGTLTIGGAPP